MADNITVAKAADEELEEGELPEAAPSGPSQLKDQAGEPGSGAFLFTSTAPSARAPFFAEEPAKRTRGGKKAKKKEKNKSSAGFFDVYGPQALASVKVAPEEGPIRVSDVQNLVLWVLGEGTNPRWCFVKNKPLVKKVVLLALHGLDSTLYQEQQGLLPSFGQLLGEPIELQARNATLVPAQTVHSLLMVPQTKKRKREEAEAAAAASQQQQPSPERGQGQQREQQQAEGSSGDVLAAEMPSTSGAAAEGEEDAGPGKLQNGAASSAAAACSQPAVSEEPGGLAAKRQRLRPGRDVSTSGGAAAEDEAAAGPTPAQVPAQAPKFASSAAQAQAPKFASLAPPPTAARHPRPFPASHYVMTLDEMRQHGYPLPLVNEAGEMVCPEGFVATQPCGGTPKHGMVALDCEMCITGAGFELTRATIVDEEGQVLMDELVVPDNPITDYNTRYSGITEEMLRGVTTRLADVQARLQQVVAAETLLVAHSGDNDLQALRVIHANMLDTSVLFPHPRGPPFKSALRVLASRHLLRTIQRESHDPVEDAKAAMDLALLKIERGPAYGASSGSEPGEKLMDVLTRHDRRCTMVDSQAALNKHVTGNCSAVVCEEDGAVWQALLKEAAKPACDIVWGQLMALHRAYEARVDALREAGQPEPSPLLQSPELGAQREGVLRGWDAQLAALWAAAEPNTMLIVFSGQGDTLYTRYLQEQKYRRQQGLDGMPAWSPACEELLARANAAAVCGLCFAAVKGLA